MSKPLVTVADVAKHNTKDDCWIIYKGKAYDISKFVEAHPGGEDVLLDLAGRDCTRDFDDVGHSESAIEMMVEFLQGDMEPVAKVVNAPSTTKETLKDDKNETAKPQRSTPTPKPRPAEAAGPNYLTFAAPALLALVSAAYYFYFRN